MAIVVSDTSPVRALQHLGLLAILGDLYGSVYIPEAVAQELRQAGRLFPAFETESHSFLIVEAPKDRARVKELEETLDPGEASAIALALEKSASRVLIDEREARTIAHNLGLTVVGVLGVLLDAKQQSLISSIRPLINRLQVELNFHISTALVANILQRAGE